MADESRMLSIRQVMRRLNVGRRTVYRLVERGWLAPARPVLLGTVRWAEVDVMIYQRRWERGDFQKELEAELEAKPARKPRKPRGTKAPPES